ncbi:hypothetical protein SAMN02910344_01882 [Ruminobacter amylophilus]|uniref:DUF6273 domain-containing protein n=1 Tax=Ruminobacter amylophilus TaxID=867 RepID=A0A662ZJ36_9GAMM|nr:DUF6273 domain-containing protein [Ruminobacter amylophilus]SFP61895.1 hypothetical protein SAMN02910344_01882 [Ruminobacter amylophilus]
MKDTKASGNQKKAPAKTGAKASTSKATATVKPSSKNQAAKTVKNTDKAAKPAVKQQTAKNTDKAAASKTAVPELKKGDYFKFGSYYQENSIKKTPIEWLVLKKPGTKVLLISRYGLDCKQYHHEKGDITWENCDLRKWLNGEFLKNAFTATEQKKIAVTKLMNDNNSKYGTFGGNSTEDRVFCLSTAEADSLFKDNESRKCVPTPYALGNGCWKSSENLINGRGCCYWWLRSPGRYRLLVAGVSTDGSLLLDGGGVCGGNIAVRPALWVNL